MQKVETTPSFAWAFYNARRNNLIRLLATLSVLLAGACLSVCQGRLGGTWTYTWTGGSATGQHTGGPTTSGNPFGVQAYATGGSNSYSVTGPATVHCVYTPPPGGSMPQYTVLGIFVDAEWAGDTGSAADGYNDPQVYIYPGPQNPVMHSSGTHYIFVGPGSPLGTPGNFIYTFPTPNASSSGVGNTPDHNEGVTINVTLTPSIVSAVISVKGPITQPGTSNQEVLVGQEQQASVTISGYPSGFTLGNYAWNPSAFDVYGGPIWGTKTPSPTWSGKYYYTSHNWASVIVNQPTCTFWVGYGLGQTETVSCAVTLYDSNGNALGTIYPTEANVIVQSPSEVETMTAGQAGVPVQFAANDIRLSSGISGQAGMTFAYAAVTPPDFSSQGYGQYTAVQLIDALWETTDANGDHKRTCSTYDLDNAFPYPLAPWISAIQGTGNITSDTPGVGVLVAPGTVYTYTARVDGNFIMFNVYEPPQDVLGNSDQIPVQADYWEWDSGTESQSSGGVWTPQPPGSPIAGTTSVPGFSTFTWNLVYDNTNGELP